MTLGLLFFGGIAMAAVSAVRHRAPLVAAPPPPAPNPFVRIAPPAPVTAPPPPSLPAETLDLDGARKDVAITIYSASWCGYCKKAKEYMNAHDLEYVERDIDDDTNAAAMRKISPKGSIPAFDVEGDTWVGWSSSRLESAIEKAAKRRLAKK